MTCAVLQSLAQRQKEITDFTEKWRIDNVSINSIKISGLPGAVKITGNDSQFLDIKVKGDDVYLLQGGATGLGMILSKDRNDDYRIQGLGDREANVTYEISIPKQVDLGIDFGNQIENSFLWQIDGMKGRIRLQRLKGDIAIDGAIGPVSISNNGGDLKLNYDKFSTQETHRISSLGDVEIYFASSDTFKLELNAHAEVKLNIDDQFEGDNKTDTLSSGGYDFFLNNGVVPLKLHVYKGQVTLGIKN